jgi:hypothetical protein
MPVKMSDPDCLFPAGALDFIKRNFLPTSANDVVLPADIVPIHLCSAFLIVNAFVLDCPGLPLRVNV